MARPNLTVATRLSMTYLCHLLDVCLVLALCLHLLDLLLLLVGLPPVHHLLLPRPLHHARLDPQRLRLRRVELLGGRGGVGGGSGGVGLVGHDDGLVELSSLVNQSISMSRSRYANFKQVCFDERLPDLRMRSALPAQLVPFFMTLIFPSLINVKQ